MKIQPAPLPLPTEWSAEQALAVYGFLLDLSAAIWEQYEDPLYRLLNGEDAPAGEQPDLFGDDSLPF